MISSTTRIPSRKGATTLPASATDASRPAAASTDAAGDVAPNLGASTAANVSIGLDLQLQHLAASGAVDIDHVAVSAVREALANGTFLIGLGHTADGVLQTARELLAGRATGRSVTHTD